MRFPAFGKALKAGAVVLSALVMCWVLLPKPPPVPELSLSRRVLDREGRLLRLTLSVDDKYRLWTPLEAIAPELIAATLRYEDEYFFAHPGVNPLALSRAAWHFVFRSGVRRGGASTIAMQLARMRYGLRSRTAGGKLLQIYRALQLSRHWSKRAILEAYLNAAPYGRNVEGVGAASLVYLGKTPAQLAAHEAVMLSVIPQNPTRRTPWTGRVNPALEAAMRRVFPRLRTEQMFETLSVDFEPRARAAPRFLAPHFVNRVLREAGARREISTTLDLEAQRVLEGRIGAYVETHRRLGISNAAALLIDCETMEVRAQVGSADFWKDSIAGQVDGTQSRRSPGSTLKPFIYALAMEQGRIHPLTMLKDAPRGFGAYSPENFDGEFVGPIAAADALARSRNLPAVALASELAHPNLYEFLQKGGVAFPRGAAHYGLALPLGGGEVTMEELARLYAALANGGLWRPFKRVLNEPDARPLRLLSPESAFLTLDMLGRVPRPGLNEPAGDSGVFWKTGTSHGFRDAWAVAVFERSVLALWVGNFDGKRNPAFIGRTCAGPLIFQMIDALRPARAGTAFRHAPALGLNLQAVEFCAVSGELPGAACIHRSSGWFIPGVSPISACGIHREVLLDEASGLRLSHEEPGRALRREVYEFWSSDLLALFEKAGLPRRRPPPYLPGHEVPMEDLSRLGNAPRISSPHAGQVFAAGADGKCEIGLNAQCEADVARLHWFADKAFLGTVTAGEMLPWNAPAGSGRHTLVVLDDHGRTSALSIRVE